MLIGFDNGVINMNVLHVQNLNHGIVGLNLSVQQVVETGVLTIGVVGVRKEDTNVR